MNKAIILASAALACFSGSSQAFAQAFSPNDTVFSASGTGIYFYSPAIGTAYCDLTLTGKTGSNAGGGKAVDGTLYGGTNSGACSAITVDPSTFVAVSYSSGVVTGEIASVVVRYNSTPICADTDVPFTIDGSGAIEFSTSIGTCEVDGVVDADTVVGVSFP